MQNYFGTFYFGKFKPHNSNTGSRRNPLGIVGTVSISALFTFAVLFSLRICEINCTQTLVNVFYTLLNGQPM